MKAWMFGRRAALLALAGAPLGQDMSDAGHAIKKAAE